MKVQKVRFDCERLAIEGRAISNICHRFEALVRNSCTRDVHPVLWDQFVVRTQVDGRHRITRAVTPSFCGGADDGERAVEQVSRSRDVALHEQLTYAAARDGFVSPAHLGINGHIEPKFFPQLS